MMEVMSLIEEEIKKLADKAYEKGRVDALKELEQAKAEEKKELVQQPQTSAENGSSSRLKNL